ncbi:MAG: LolA family protein [Hyphococcus sp.]
MISSISLICAPAPAAAAPDLAAAPVVVAQAEPIEPVDLSAPPITPVAAGSEQAAEALISDEEEYTGPLAFEGESDADVAERLVAYIEGLETLQGDFTQIAPSGAVSAGRFYLRRPGFLRFEYDPPTPLLIVANGGLVYVRDEALETTDSYPVGKTPLKFFLRKPIDRDDAEIVAVDRGVDTVAVTFASRAEETEGELTVIAQAPEMTLTRWIVRDLQNGITVVSLDNVEEGVRLANRLFRAPDAGGQFLKN